MRLEWKSRPVRILCFDIENKPGTYGPGEYTHPKVTAIGARFLDREDVVSWCLDRTNETRMRRAVLEFRAMWEQATVVMGHYIKGHDVKILNGMMISLGLPILPGRRMIDTCKDIPKAAGLSKSLENLCHRWGCPLEKVNMPEYVWEQAYDGIPEGIRMMRLRVETDVNMNVWLFHELRRRGLLP